MTMNPASASFALLPLRSAKRFQLVASTEPVSGTQTGAGAVCFAGGTTMNARAMSSEMKPVFRPAFGVNPSGHAGSVLPSDGLAKKTSEVSAATQYENP
jgi:hypothetical protein